MTFKDFITEFGIDINNCQVNQSETQTYEGSDTPVVYVSLNKPVENQDWLVLSQTLAQKVLENPAELSKADAKLDPNYGWGLICHANVKSLGSLSSFFK